MKDDSLQETPLSPHLQRRAEELRAEDVAAETARLTPPSEAGTSTVLNGIGNGAMVGTTPFIGLELYHNIVEHGTGKPMPKGAYILCAFALATGSAIGAVMGMREASRLKAYRTALGEEVMGLRDKTDATQLRLQR